MKKTFFAVALAGICAVGANAALNKADNGCYQIGDYTALKEFATKVNGGETDACGQVTGNIDATASKTAATAWTPIMGFTGYFEGNGKTISNLSFTGNSSDNVGLFGSVAGGAVIRNVILGSASIVAQSSVGGIVGDVTGTGVVIDGCGVDDKSSIKGYKNTGGLVGSIATGAQLIVANSYNAGTIGASKSGGSDKNGLIGFANSGSSVALINCYISAESIKDNPVGNKENGATFSVTDVGCVKWLSWGVVSMETRCTAKISGVTEYNGTNAATAYNTNVANSDYQASLLAKELAVNSSAIPNVSGVTISNEESKLVATLNDAATTLSIPQDIKVNEVRLDRSFTKDVYSTIMLPFSVAVTSVTGATEFATFTGVTKNAEENAYTAVEGTRVNGDLAAYTPYLLKTSGTTLTVSGAVTLKANPANTTTTVNNWSFIGTTAKKRWQNQCEADASKCENADEIGNVYGFSGSEVGDIHVGNFVKVGNKVAIRPMRAYLMYTGSENLPVAKGKPAAPGMAMAAAVESVPTVILPDTMKVIIVDPVVEDPEEDVPTEGPLALDPIKAPAAAFKADRWYDITGRNLNKPKAQGAYINNRTTVIVK
ncbi:hypothetical protein [Fibrobacter sp. UWEL]|uniref:hypothetical protein n=1 Tax=Fibrobacter sp. UWEL TaxID=1896209 RepID=UPI0009167445|nr:hypothetical protein [Fibrobacter sp. UWEL]SHL31070.1 hypothetical protein SAMN05720468_12151 [Fibrobacter sp. UWEL]